MSSTQFQEFEPSQQDLEQLFISLEQPLEQNHSLPVDRTIDTSSGVRRVTYSTVLAGYGIASVLKDHELSVYNEVSVKVRTSPEDRTDPRWAEVIFRNMLDYSRPQRSTRYAIYRDLNFSIPGTYAYRIIKNLPSMDIDDFDLEHFDEADDENPDVLAAEAQLEFFEDQLRRVSPADIQLLGSVASELAQTI